MVPIYQNFTAPHPRIRQCYMALSFSF